MNAFVVIIVSVEPSVCPGSLPNAFLEPFCILTPSYSSCDFTCKDGYRKLDFPYIKRGHRNSPDEISILIFCEHGAWVTNLEEYGYGINEICLPEGIPVYCQTEPNDRALTFDPFSKEVTLSVTYFEML